MTNVAGGHASSQATTLSTVLAMLRVPAWIGALYALLTTNVDPDLWGHVRFGLDALSSGRLSDHDPYSYTSDVPWLNHEWLSEVVMGAAYRGLGPTGLVMLKIALTVATFALIASVVRRAPEVWRWPTAFLAVVGITPIALTVRPQLWTLLFVVILCRVLNGPPRNRWMLPLMFALWVNLHGGWIVGVGILSLWSIVEVAGRGTDRPSRWISVGVPVACAMATLMNPYGIRMWRFIAETVQLSREDIIEWQPVWRESGGPLVLWLVAIGWSTLALHRASTWRPQATAVVTALGFAAMRVNRLLPLFISASVILLLPLAQQTPQAVRVWPRGRLLVDLAVICIGVLLSAWPGSAGCIRMQGAWLPDLDAGRALAMAHPTGRMASSFNWGEYAIWHFGPAAKISVDGRRETVYSDQQLQRQVAMAFGEDAGLEELARAVPEYVWLPAERSERTLRWLTAHNYRIDLKTPQSFVAVRADQPIVAAASGPPAPCFPGL